MLKNVYLSIPSSSASSEREFSAAELTTYQLRTNLNPQTVDSVFVLQSTLSNGKFLILIDIQHILICVFRTVG